MSSEVRESGEKWSWPARLRRWARAAFRPAARRLLVTVDPASPRASAWEARYGRGPIAVHHLSSGDLSELVAALAARGGRGGWEARLELFGGVGLPSRVGDFRLAGADDEGRSA
jgi:hypothetical protein